MSLNAVLKYVSIRTAEIALITWEPCSQILKYSYNMTTHLQMIRHNYSRYNTQKCHYFPLPSHVF